MWFGQAACDANMMAYAQLEVMAMLPSLKVAKMRNPEKLDEADLKVRQFFPRYRTASIAHMLCCTFHTCTVQLSDNPETHTEGKVLPFRFGSLCALLACLSCVRTDGSKAALVV